MYLYIVFFSHFLTLLHSEQPKFHSSIVYFAYAVFLCNIKEFEYLLIIQHMCFMKVLILTGQKMKIIEFANSIDKDEVAQYEPPHLDLHCLPSSLGILSMICLGQNTF